jgi:SAM-dependent methyltransferase
METPWFESWFDSPYYPLLYQHRDDQEAERFIAKLLGYLQLPAQAQVLDLACGRGRHARYIHAQGYDVTGLDLSPASIHDANLHAAPGLRFGVQDMRDPLPAHYDLILNLFTSFGYFEDPSDNLRVLRNVSAALLPGGTFVMDFFNAEKVLAGLVPSDEKVLQGIHFGITKEVINGIIVKRIHVQDGDQHYDFQERVQALHADLITQLMQQAGLVEYARWGGYDGRPWDPAAADRLVIFARRPA